MGQPTGSSSAYEENVAAYMVPATSQRVLLRCLGQAIASRRIARKVIMKQCPSQCFQRLTCSKHAGDDAADLRGSGQGQVGQAVARRDDADARDRDEERQRHEYGVGHAGAGRERARACACWEACGCACVGACAWFEAVSVGVGVGVRACASEHSQECMHDGRI
eukprot:6206921-Pleurochrysis_carterae.AAC.5